MAKASRWAVMARALVYGACMGALAGGPVFGAFFVVAAVIGGPRMFAVALLVTVIGSVFGGIVGLAGSVLPGIVVASMSGYFRGHLRTARACAAAMSGVEVDTVFVVGHGGLGAAAATGGGVAFLIFAFGLFAAVGAYSPNYVIAGRRCALAHRVVRCLRQICPCRRFRLDILPAV